MNKDTLTSPFAIDVMAGLSATPKTLPSKYFYDENGDQLFQQIMRLKSYYPTNSEYEIFSLYKNELARQFSANGEAFNLIEFGAGDGYKTKVLLNHFVDEALPFQYLPIDISPNVLNSLENDLKKNLPQLAVKPVQGEYFKALKTLNELDQRPKVVLFLGSNIGNFTNEQAIRFLQQMRESMNPTDQAVIGFDLKKDPKVILAAYNDPEGVTKAFNLNLLKRINNELGGTFDMAKFDHFPTYDPLTGTTKSFLISTVQQEVQIEALNQSFQFDAWEAIHTEISQKFDEKMIHTLAEKAGFKVERHFFDCKHYYLNSVWRPC
jgi:dimethylhistidine N-methyltransferase